MIEYGIILHHIKARIAMPTTSNFNNIFNFKYRFVAILNYLGSDNAKRAAKEITNLPDKASDGFHDAYLTSKVISITLTYMTPEECMRFKTDLIRSNLLASLFGYSDIEEMADESIDNIFICCSENPDESLEDSLAGFIGSTKVKRFESIIKELVHLKISCESFIDFYDENKTDIKITLSNFKEVVKVENTHKGPQPEALQNTIFLSNPGEKSVITTNGSLIINNLRPCLGLVILAENENKSLACSAYHHMSADNDTESELNDMVFQISQLTKELAEKEFTNNIRFFITGCDFYTFPLALRLITYYWNANKLNHIADLNFYFLPSPQGCWSYCLVKLVDDLCSIKAGSELHNLDSHLCAQRGIFFECASSEEDSDFYSSEDESLLKAESSEEISKDKKQKRVTFFYSDTSDDSSSSDEPLNKKSRKG